MRNIIVIIFLALCEISPASAMSVDNLKKQVLQAEKHYSIPEGVLDSIITIESNYNRFAKNPANFKKNVFVSSFGLGQITYASASQHCSLSKKSVKNPVKNIFCSSKILRYQLNRYDDSILYAVAAYNLGTPCICDGKKYVKEIKGNLKACKKTNTHRIITCSKNEINKFLNQDYVDKFVLTYRKLYPNIPLDI